MGKRLAEPSDDEPHALKSGERPVKAENGDMVGDFEDEFEDEFDSEDEIFEAGVDGQPDAEREAEESRGMWITLKLPCEYTIIDSQPKTLTRLRCYGYRSADIHTRT